MKKVEFKIATINDLSDCIKIRLAAISGKDRKYFGASSDEMERTEEDWKDFFFGENRFTYLFFIDSKVKGISMAKKKPNGTWWIFSVYVLDEEQGKGIGKEMLEFSLKETEKQGGEIIRAGIANKNKRSLHVFRSFGFKPVNKFKQFLITDKGHRRNIFWCNIVERFV